MRSPTSLHPAEVSHGEAGFVAVGIGRFHGEARFAMPFVSLPRRRGGNTIRA